MCGFPGPDTGSADGIDPNVLLGLWDVPLVVGVEANMQCMWPLPGDGDAVRRWQASDARSSQSTLPSLH